VTGSADFSDHVTQSADFCDHVTQPAVNGQPYSYGCQLQGDQHLKYVDYDTLLHIADRWELFSDRDHHPMGERCSPHPVAATSNDNDKSDYITTTVNDTNINIINTETTSSIIDL